MELIEGRDLLEIRGLNCSKHGPVATDPHAPYRMRILRNIYQRLSQADRDAWDRRLKERQVRPEDARRDYRVNWTDFRPGQPCPQRHMVNLRIVASGVPVFSVSGMTAGSLIGEGSTIAGFQVSVCSTCGQDFLSATR